MTLSCRSIATTLNGAALASELVAVLSVICTPGIGGLGMSIEGPGKVDIKCFENPGGTCRVAYKPTEPGTYQLSVKYADEHIPGLFQSLSSTSLSSSCCLFRRCSIPCNRLYSQFRLSVSRHLPCNFYSILMKFGTVVWGAKSNNDFVRGLKSDEYFPFCPIFHPIVHFQWEGPNTAVTRPVDRLWRLTAQTTCIEKCYSGSR